MKPDYEPLFEDLTLRSGVRLKNRLAMAPMTTMSANPDDSVSDAEIRYYSRRSGGVGMVITACAYVSSNGKGFPGEISVHDDTYIPGLKRLAAAIKEKGAKAVLQIFHGGRMSPAEFVPDGDVVSASEVPPAQGVGLGTMKSPRPLANEEIEGVIREFGEATRRAVEAGFDGVEIHGANGYLLQQFFSPYTNRREDRWGGSVENRLRFPLAIVDEVKRTVQAHAGAPFLVGYRFSPEEPETPGITMAETFVLIDALADKGLDYLHVSLNDFWAAPRRGTEDTRSRMEIIQDRVVAKVPVMGVGAIRTPDEAAKALRTGVSLIAIGRELVVDPDWAEKTMEGREAEIATTLTKDDQQKLVVPDPLWQTILHVPGWFPLAE
ncbi:NADH-dependent flavin oxidoreductase [Cohnella suwonensis]|uniref:NADH-dependent flavin oxidoreductase n=1 Tax=Cohnella suwonensis TaxID=696072 RepID=A0ABW0LZY6_9BACL